MDSLWTTSNGTLGMGDAEGLVGPTVPGRVDLVAAGVGEMPERAFVPLFRDPVGMAVCDHLDVVPGLDEAAGEIRGMPLHAADPVH